MLNSGKKIWATKKINILNLVLSETPPPCTLNGRSLTHATFAVFTFKSLLVLQFVFCKDKAQKMTKFPLY